MNKPLHLALPLRRVAAGVTLSLVALASVAGLSGCDRRQSEVPMPTPGGGGQTTPSMSPMPKPMPTPMPDATPINPMGPAPAASR